MTREFLKNLGLEDAAIDSVLEENGKDIKKADSGASALQDVRQQLAAAQSELEALKKSGGEAAAAQQLSSAQHQLAELQKKYESDTAALQAQLADRDYADAIRRTISEKGLKFSSRSAEKAFTDSLRDQKLELKDGQLGGVDDFIKAQRAADPDAFARPAPRYLAPLGSGGAPEKPVSRAAQLAAEYQRNVYGTEKESE